MRAAHVLKSLVDPLLPTGPRLRTIPLGVEADRTEYERLCRNIAANPAVAPAVEARHARVTGRTDDRGDITLDDAAFGEGSPPPDLVKLDVEGLGARGAPGRPAAAQDAQAVPRRRDALRGARGRLPRGPARPRLRTACRRAEALARGGAGRAQPVAGRRGQPGDGRPGMSRHEIGTNTAQTRAFDAGIVEHEGGGRRPTRGWGFRSPGPRGHAP